MGVDSRADATWTGDLKSGSGTVKPASGAFGELPLSWAKRAEDRTSETSPEELLGAAHAGCYSMQLSAFLAQAGHPAERIGTSAVVGFQAGVGITGIKLTVRATVPGMDAATFADAAERAKANCPVSKALSGVEITLDAALEN